MLTAGFGGLAAGAIVAWALSRNLGNVWRRASVAMMGLMGSAVVGGITMPAHNAAGARGLVILFTVCLAAIASAWALLLRRA